MSSQSSCYLLWASYIWLCGPLLSSPGRLYRVKLWYALIVLRAGFVIAVTGAAIQYSRRVIMYFFTLLLLVPLLIFCDDLDNSENKLNQLLVVNHTELMEEPSIKSKRIFKLMPTLILKSRLNSHEKNKNWIYVDSGFCSLKTKHEKEECNSTKGYVLSKDVTEYNEELFKDLFIIEEIKFTNFNSEPNLNYVFNTNGEFYHHDPICGEGKCGLSKLKIYKNIIWSKPLRGDFVYKFFIDENDKICAPYPGPKGIFPCSKEKIQIKK